MKNRVNFRGTLIFVLILALIMSTTPLAFADTVDSWEIMAPMSVQRVDFGTEVIEGKIFAIGGSNGSTTISILEEYDPSTNAWSTKTPMPTPRCYLQTEVIDGKIYAIGGNEGNDAVSTLEEYDPASNTWTTKAPMSVPRQYFQTEVVNGKIYAIGGHNSKGIVSTLEEYDPALNTWTTKAPMLTPSEMLQTVVVNGKIYAIGGHSTGSSGIVSSVEEYDPELNTWATKASMAIPRSNFQTEVVNGKIYAIGGNSSNSLTSSVEEYDVTLNKWVTMASMSTPRARFQTEAVNGKIYAMGSFDGGHPSLSSVEEYDLASNIWETKASMSSPRFEFQTEAYGGEIYAIGGSSYSNGNYNSLSSVEAYTAAPSDPTLTVAASPNKLKVGEQFSAAVAIHNVTNICAEDVTITYDTDLFDYVGVNVDAGIQVNEEDKSTPGTIRFIVSSLGKDNAAMGDKGLINLTFRAKAPGIGKVDITKGRIADNTTLEMDVAEENCGEDTITVEAVKDVNRSGEFTLIDLGIDAWYYGMDATDTDTTKFDTDVVADGIIDNSDLASITQSILSNSNYGSNNL